MKLDVGKPSASQEPLEALEGGVVSNQCGHLDIAILALDLALCRGAARVGETAAGKRLRVSIRGGPLQDQAIDSVLERYTCWPAPVTGS